MTYHAGEETWKGTLTILNPLPDQSGTERLIASRFYDEAPGVFKLLSKLDAKWRAFLRDRLPQETPENKGEAGISEKTE